MKHLYQHLFYFKRIRNFTFIFFQSISKFFFLIISIKNDIILHLLFAKYFENYKAYRLKDFFL